MPQNEQLVHALATTGGAPAAGPSPQDTFILWAKIDPFSLKTKWDNSKENKAVFTWIPILSSLKTLLKIEI